MELNPLYSKTSIVNLSEWTMQLHIKKVSSKETFSDISASNIFEEIYQMIRHMKFNNQYSRFLVALDIIGNSQKMKIKLLKLVILIRHYHQLNCQIMTLSVGVTWSYLMHLQWLIIRHSMCKSFHIQLLKPRESIKWR